MDAPWKPRKTDKPLTSSELQHRINVIALEVQALEAEQREIESAMPNLAMNDLAGAFRIAESRLAATTSLLPIKQRTRALLEIEIENARAREGRADLEARLAKQSLKSDKLARSLPARYAAAAAALVAILREIDEDTDAVEALNSEARELGLSTIFPAEYRARKDFRAATRDGFASVIRVKLPSWDGEWLWHRK
jgi:hypothetical protein